MLFKLYLPQNTLRTVRRLKGGKCVACKGVAVIDTMIYYGELNCLKSQRKDLVIRVEK